MDVFKSVAGNTKLNEVIMVGSHDAGIATGDSNTKAQDYNIGLQAACGARFFDIRIIATLRKSLAGEKVATFKTVHAADFLQREKTKVRLVPQGRYDENRRGVYVPGELTTTKLTGGSEGETLHQVLQQAKDFVTTHEPGECLFLDFNHCTNWPQIAVFCTEVLGNTMYDEGGLLNTTEVSRLRGKVVVLFPESVMNQAWGGLEPYKANICRQLNLKTAGGGIPQNFNGMVYYGKGGTTNGIHLHKVTMNLEKQIEMMYNGSGMDRDVMGRMYWTTTGFTSKGINGRNDSMWKDDKTGYLIDAIGNLATDCRQHFAEELVARLPPNLTPNFASGTTLRAIRPNIVMIDFVNIEKCKAINDLNQLSTTQLVPLIARHWKPPTRPGSTAPLNRSGNG